MKSLVLIYLGSILSSNCVALDIPQSKIDQILKLDSCNLVEHTTDLSDEEEDDLLSIANETVADGIDGLAEACEQTDTLLRFLNDINTGNIKLTDEFHKKCLEIWLQTVNHCVIGEGVGPIHDQEVRAKINELLTAKIQI